MSGDNNLVIKPNLTDRTSRSAGQNDEVIAIRLNGFGIIHPLRDKQKIRQIFPSEQLGPVMRFDPATSRRNIQMGYYDTMRFMRELPGQLYYFSEKADGFAAFAALPENAIKAAGIPLRLPEGLSPRRALFEHILPAVAAELRLPREAGYDDLLLALAEQREVMLFDEWAADQDPQFRRIFYQVLLPRLKEMGKTVIAISHDDHYFSLADRLLEMRQGRLTELTGEQRKQVSRDAVAHLDGKVPA